MKMKEGTKAEPDKTSLSQLNSVFLRKCEEILSSLDQERKEERMVSHKAQYSVIFSFHFPPFL